VKRIAIVVQRYAEEISGGAERHARLVAELLARHYAVEVLTSCALDYTRWSMDFPPGPCTVNGIPVLRFAHPQRNDIGRARVLLVHKLRFKLRRLLRGLPGPLVLPSRGEPGFDGLDFLRRQGPHCPGLFAHLEASADRYDAVVFFTALYEPAAIGIQRWGRRSILVPLLHDEKPMYQPVMREVMRSAGAILFNSDSERRLAGRLYGIDTSASPLAGIGVEMPVPEPNFAAAVLARFKVAPGYFVYVGRVDVAKGCRELIEAFIAHARTDPTARLVLVGQSVMEVPPHPGIVQTGFVTEAERDALVAGAAALVIPSRYESLSAVLLEAMLLHTPVIANGDCEVLADHIRLSGAGLAYSGQARLRAALRAMRALAPAERERLGRLGSAYVRQHYTWDRVAAVFAEAIARVSAEPPGPGPAPGG
jgi:glycosyltransferase involved in cell wall biosynthesis